jgi:MFS family permease
VLLAGVAGGIAFPVIPLLGVRVGLPLWFIGTILAANRAGRIVSAPIVGVLTDRWGGRRMVILGLASQVVVMALYLVGVVGGNPGLYFLLARLLHGPASACVFVGAQTLALHAGGPSHGGLAAGMVRAAMSAGMPVGLAVGGLLAAVAGERSLFEAAMAVVGLGAVLAFLTVPDLRAPSEPRPRELAVWKIFSDRRLLVVGLLNFAMFFSAQGVVLTTIVLVVNSRELHLNGLGAQGTAGIAMFWMVLISTATMLLSGRLGDRRRIHAGIAAFGIAITIPGLVAVGLGNSVAVLSIGIALVGLGMGALGPSLLALLATFVAPERRGRAAGALQLCGDVGGVLGPIAGTTLIAGGAATPYFVCAGVLSLVLPVAVWLARLERRAGRTAAGQTSLLNAPTFD